MIFVNQTGSGAICADILFGLPEWFGVEEANADYVRMAETNETLIATGKGNPIGLLTLKPHSPYASEIYLVAVRRAQHRNGVGRALVHAAEELLRERGVEFLPRTSVKDRPPLRRKILHRSVWVSARRG